jgi:hypothetical protein
MATKNQSNEEIIEDFLKHIHLMSKYWANIKLQEIRRGTRRSLSIAQAKLLKELMAKDGGKEALRMLLLDYNDLNIFSVMTYIDGSSGVKPVELVNADTGEPLADGYTHEYWSSFNPLTTKSKLVL